MTTSSQEEKTTGQMAVQETTVSEEVGEPTPKLEGLTTITCQETSATIS
jgi:hypothetical protein